MDRRSSDNHVTSEHHKHGQYSKRHTAQEQPISKNQPKQSKSILRRSKTEQAVHSQSRHTYSGYTQDDINTANLRRKLLDELRVTFAHRERENKVREEINGRGQRKAPNGEIPMQNYQKMGNSSAVKRTNTIERGPR